MSARDYLSHFTLWGDFEVDDVTLKLGLPPSATYAKGETSLTGLPALISTWDLYCPVDIAMSEEQVQYLIAKLWPHADALRDFTTRFQGHICIAGDADLCLLPTTLQKMVYLNVTLNFSNHKGERSVEEELSA